MKNQRVIVITGSCGGIGSAMVKHFKNNGDYVIGVDNIYNEECDLNIKTDLSDVEISSVVIRNQILNNIEHGRVDCLINNAAIQIKSKIGKTEYKDFKQTLDVNLLAPFFISQSLKDLLTGGTIINISSIHASQSKKDFLMYATSKGAMKTMTQNMALEFSPNTSVIGISPAAVDTPMLKDGLSKDSYKKLSEYHPTKHIGDPNRLAEFVSSLIDNSHFLTGTNIEWDGGISKVLNDPE